jgi:NADH dehydrogenase
LFTKFWPKVRPFDKPIVVVGGGAGGLELVTKLGRYFKGSAQKVILIDQNRKHVWKPLLHEVAAGSLDADIDGVDYLSHASKNSFTFLLGQVDDLNQDLKQVSIQQLNDLKGKKVVGETRVAYSILVFALGSVTNDFGTKGVKENCIFLDTCENAEQFHTDLLNAFLRIQTNPNISKLNIAIIGGGATGVELAAELVKTSELLISYGYDHVSQKRLNINLVEASNRILGPLPEHVANNALAELKILGINVHVNTVVTDVTNSYLQTKDGAQMESQLTVWAAGIKAPNFLQGIGGLESAKNNQLVVNTFLQTTEDENIFAIGDCAACITPKGIKVPPRAQSAHQMADNALLNIIAISLKKPLKEYEYIDYGSIVSLSSYTSVGNLMGSMNKRTMFTEGRLARIVYIALYRMHQVALFGFFKTFLIMLVGRLNRTLRPNLKLH